MSFTLNTSLDFTCNKINVLETMLPKYFKKNASKNKEKETCLNTPSPFSFNKRYGGKVQARLKNRKGDETYQMRRNKRKQNKDQYLSVARLVLEKKRKETKIREIKFEVSLILSGRNERMDIKWLIYIGKEKVKAKW